MPVNSFDNYPMNWKPDKKMLKFPMYLSLADLLEQDIISGRLPANTQLPPQRELADFLDVNLSTITRAFKCCETKGLIYAIIGRGTFVSPNAALPGLDISDGKPYIELGLIRPYYQFNTDVADAARRILQGTYSDKLFEFEFTSGNDRHRKIAEKWLSEFQLNTSADHIILASGTQNALAITLLSLFKAGDKIVSDVYTYSNFISLAKQLGIQLIPAEADSEGMLPDSLEKQCNLMDIKGVYLMPSYHNPTSITMSAERRKEIGLIIKKKNILLIEDDTYGFMAASKLSPLAALIPENTVYVHGLSKSLSAGLRIAYLVIPYKYQKLFHTTANNITLKIPMLNAEIASELILSGMAKDIIKRKCKLSKERNQLYAKFFPDSVSANPYGFFQWLPLPEKTDGYHFEVQAGKRGVTVLCSDRFAVGSTSQFSAIRIATCSPETTKELENGLQIVREILEENQLVIQRQEFII